LTDRPSWLLLDDGGADGAWNMAVDEALLDGWAAGPADAPPLLRLYGWSPAALSLGRAQPARASHDAAVLRERGVGLVRRPTGGLAVLHDREVTYAVVARSDRGRLAGGVVETYRRIAGAIVAGLRELGVDATAVEPRQTERTGGPSCFAATSAWELAAHGRKLVGSAQLRRRGAMLQHGSIPLRLDERELGAALGGAAPGRFTDLAAELGGEPRPAAVRAALVGGFAAAFGGPPRVTALDAELTLRATGLRAWKYLSAVWTIDGTEPDGPSARR